MAEQKLVPNTLLLKTGTPWLKSSVYCSLRLSKATYVLPSRSPFAFSLLPVHGPCDTVTSCSTPKVHSIARQAQSHLESVLVQYVRRVSLQVCVSIDSFYKYNSITHELFASAEDALHTNSLELV